LSGNESLRDTSRELREQLETAFVNFQFGDRVGQMLSIVGGDMMSFARWVADNPRCTQTDAAQWLTALESSYTMDEQRSTHHGNVHVNRGAGVEFF
jgi:methyl-accepting chemotaxis protein